MHRRAGAVTVGEGPRTKPEEIVLPVAWDVVAAKADPRLRVISASHRSGAGDGPPLKLADRAKLRREDFGGFVHIGQYSQAVNDAGAELLADFARARRPAAGEFEPASQAASEAGPDLGFIALMQDSGVLVPARVGDESSAELFHFDARGPARPLPAGTLRSPLGLEFEITNKCYRKCTYCAYGSGPEPTISRAEELRTEEWLQVLDEAADLGVFIVEFTGGDPFVRTDAMTLLRHASDRGITLLINSDLSVLSDEHIEWLGDLPTLHAVQTSLDGATAESCDRTRGPGGFKTLLRQLRRLAAAGLPVSVGTTVHAGNYREVSAIAQLAADNGARRLYVGPMYAAGRASALGDQVVTADQWATAMRQYATAVLDGIVQPTDAAWFELAPAVAAGDLSAVAEQVQLTSRGTRTLRVDPRGRAYVSAKLRELHPRFGSLGSVVELSLQAVWEGSRQLAELRSQPRTNAYFDAVDVRAIPAADLAPPSHVLELETHRAAR
jgi:MoaA/NifB/PqqE/SkfB family radical SAM enzyme